MKNLDYQHTYGTWQVSTEGDCEGRTYSNLGTFTGHIDEIALYLGNKAMYGLRFKAVENIRVFNPTVSSVNVSLDIDSGDWNLSSTERVGKMKKLFSERPVEILESNYYASFQISLPNRKEFEQKELKRKALEKLTPEEKIALGL